MLRQQLLLLLLLEVKTIVPSRRIFLPCPHPCGLRALASKQPGHQQTQTHQTAKPPRSPERFHTRRRRHPQETHEVTSYPNLQPPVSILSSRPLSCRHVASPPHTSPLTIARAPPWTLSAAAPVTEIMRQHAGGGGRSTHGGPSRQWGEDEMDPEAAAAAAARQAASRRPTGSH